MNVVFKPVKNQTVRIQVVEQIIKMVRDGKLKPGDQLPSERIIAEQMGISRPTVREAVAALEVVGMVETRIGQGTFIKSIDLENFKYRAENLFVEERSPYEILETRKILESYSASLAAERATDEDLLKIRKAMEALEEEAEIHQTWSESADRLFHEAIANASNNDVLSDILDILLDMSHHKLWLKLKELDRLSPGSLERNLREHRSIYLAIQERNPEKAREAVWNHFVDVEKFIFET